MEHTLAEQGKSSPAIHHTLDQLDFGHLTFDFSIYSMVR
jgi:hypothetical protein